MFFVFIVGGSFGYIKYFGLDAESRTSGRNKIEEKLMDSFIEGKGNLDFFARGVDEIAAEISLGMEEYEVEKRGNVAFFDEGCNVNGRPFYENG